MGYYDFPHTRNYDTDLGYLINWFKTNKNKIEENTAITIEKALTATEEAIKAANSATSASNSATSASNSATSASNSAELIISSIAYVTPEMFGAVGDGVHDDTQSVKDAINAGNVVLLKNKYLISNTIQITKNGICIYGGKYGFIKSKESNFVFEINASNISIEGLYIYGGIKIIGGNNNNFHALRIETDHIGIELNRTGAISLSGSFIDKCYIIPKEKGIVIDGSNNLINDITIINTFVDGKTVASRGLEVLNHCQAINIINSSFLSCGIGLSIDGQSNNANIALNMHDKIPLSIQIDGCYIDSNITYGLRVRNAAVITINSCWFSNRNNSYSLLLQEYSHNIKVNECHFIWCSKPIYAVGNTREVCISNTSFISVCLQADEKSCINLDNGKGYNVTNCIFTNEYSDESDPLARGVAERGILSNNGSVVNIIGNIFKDIPTAFTTYSGNVVNSIGNINNDTIM